MPPAPAAIPATCVPWNDSFGSSGSLPARPLPGPGKARATITFGVVHFVPPFGKPGGYARPAGSRNRLSWSRPSSTMAIFTPAPPAPARAAETIGADQGGTAVEGERVAVARVHARGERERDEIRKPARGQLDGEPVEHDPVAARDGRLRDRPREHDDRRALRRLEPREVDARGEARRVQPAHRPASGERPAEGGCERWLGQRHDHPHAASAASRRHLDRAGPDERRRELALRSRERLEVGRRGSRERQRRGDGNEEDGAAHGRGRVATRLALAPLAAVPSRPAKPAFGPLAPLDCRMPPARHVGRTGRVPRAVVGDGGGRMRNRCGAAGVPLLDDRSARHSDREHRGSDDCRGGPGYLRPRRDGRSVQADRHAYGDAHNVAPRGRERPRGVVEDCSRISGFGESFTTSRSRGTWSSDPGPASRGPDAGIRRLRRRDREQAVRSRQGRPPRDSGAVTRTRWSAGLGFGFGPNQGEVRLRDSRRVVTFIACRHGEYPGRTHPDGWPVSGWVGGLLARSPRCVPLLVWVDDEPSPPPHGHPFWRAPLRVGAPADVFAAGLPEGGATVTAAAFVQVERAVPVLVRCTVPRVARPSSFASDAPGTQGAPLPDSGCAFRARA